MKWTESIVNGVVDGLDPEENNISFHYEALDSKEFNSQEYFDEFIRLLKLKYEGHDFSLILCSDNNAFDLLRQYHKTAFPGVPVVFCGVNDFDPSMIEDHKEFTGIAEVPSVISTVDLMLQLHPDTEELYVVNDYLKTGRAWQKQIESDLQGYEERLKIRYSENLSLKELQTEISSLSPGTLILSGVYYTDKNGIISSYERMAELIASTAKVPFYTLVDFNIQENVIGGKVISGYVYGEAISKIGLRILAGESPWNIPVGSFEYNEFIFNFPALEKFDISIKDLPENSIIINRPFSIYEEYFIEIWLALLIMVLLTLAVITLVFSALNKRKYAKSLKQLSDATWEGIIIHDRGVVIQINTMFTTIFGYTLEDMQGKNFIDLIVAPGSVNDVRQRVIENNLDTYETTGVRKDGSFIPAEVRVRRIEIDGKPARVAAIRDLSDKKKAEQEYAYLQNLWDSMFENSAEAIFIQNTDGIIEKVNKSMLRITGYSKDELLGSRISQFYSEYFTDDINENIDMSLATTGSWSGEMLNRRKSGELFSMIITVSLIQDISMEDRKIIGVFQDISTQKKQEEELNWMSKYDSLTGFSNRTLFLDILKTELKASERAGEICAVMLFNLDGLKNINNTYGFITGDHIIKEFSGRLKSALRDEDLVSRFGGDEFAVLAPRFTEAQQIDSVVKRIRDNLIKPIHYGAYSIDLSVSIGISLFPADGTSENELIAKSGIALQRTKANRKGFYSLFNEEDDRSVMIRSELEMSLRKSIKNKELDVFYQPKIDPAGNSVHSFEALVRWHRNKEEWIAPDIFIPISEGNGFITEIGYFVIEKACDFILYLQEKEYDEFQVGVNISAKQFSDPAFINNLIEIIESKGVHPSHIDLEVTESITASKIYNAIDCLSRLSGYGFSISIDDFGTGYSSLQYLLTLPFDTIKIDKSFVDSILMEEGNVTVLDTMISLAHSLNKSVVAEGAETSEQVEYLKDKGCELIQGYYYSKPLPAAEIIQFLESDRFRN